MTGTQVVARGDQTVGTVKFDFSIDNQGRVTGRIFDVEWMGLHASAPTVSQEFLPKLAGVPRDLALVLPDGRRVEFSVPSTNGNIANGIVVQKGSDD